MVFKPVPGLLGSFCLDLIPDPDIESPVKNSHGLGIGIVPGGNLSVVIGEKMVIVGHFDLVLRPHSLEAGDFRSSGVSPDATGPGGHSGSGIVSRFDRVTFDDVVDFGNHEDTNHLLRPPLEVTSIEARDVGDGESGGFVGRGHVDLW